MKRRTFMSLVPAVAAGLAVGAAGHETLVTWAQPGGPHAGHGGQAGDADATFLREMIMHHAMAVMMTRPVVTSAPHAELRDLAAAIVADQSREISQMRGWLQDWYGMAMPDPVAMMDAMHGAGAMHGAMGAGAGHDHAMPGRAGMGMGMAAMDSAMMAMHQGMMGMMMEMMHDIGELPGPRMETVFMALMIPHHQHAVEMATALLSGTPRAELRALARAVVDTQTAEIDQMNRWLRDWYGL